jgi:ABC-type microcin C transport system duplicated ATPase subunit YejF
MVFQDPLSSMHPMYRVGWQIDEAIRAHEKVSKRALREWHEIDAVEQYLACDRSALGACEAESRERCHSLA